MYEFDCDACGERFEDLVAAGTDVLLSQVTLAAKDMKAIEEALTVMQMARKLNDKEQLDGRYVDTTKDNFTQTLLISCYSFTVLAKRAFRRNIEDRQLVLCFYWLNPAGVDEAFVIYPVPYRVEQIAVTLIALNLSCYFDNFIASKQVSDLSAEKGLAKKFYTTIDHTPLFRCLSRQHSLEAQVCQKKSQQSCA